MTGTTGFFAHYFDLIKTINAAYPFSSAGRYLDWTHTTSCREKSITQLLRHTGFAESECFQEESGSYNLLAFTKLIVGSVRTLIRALIYFSEANWPRIIFWHLTVYTCKQ